jgi:amino acid transporter
MNIALIVVVITFLSIILIVLYTNRKVFCKKDDNFAINSSPYFGSFGLLIAVFLAFLGIREELSEYRHEYKN